MWTKFKKKETKDLEFLFFMKETLPCITVIELCKELLSRDTELNKEQIKQIMYSAIHINNSLKREGKRVNAFNPRLTNRVLHLGKTKGLGFDIQSVIAEKGDKAEFSRYIEVKSTKRVTVPNFDEENWLDTVNITRNEWIAAQQHKDLYSIFRVYFVRGHVITCIIENPFEKENGNKINVTPLMYRLDFNKNAIDKTHREERVANV